MKHSTIERTWVFGRVNISVSYQRLKHGKTNMSSREFCSKFSQCSFLFKAADTWATKLFALRVTTVQRERTMDRLLWQGVCPKHEGSHRHRAYTVCAGAGNVETVLHRCGSPQTSVSLAKHAKPAEIPHARIFRISENINLTFELSWMLVTSARLFNRDGSKCNSM